DIAGLPQLREITFAQDVAELGSAVTVETIAHHPRIQQELTALGQAAAAIGNPQVRRAATLGGNVAVAAGTSDLCSALLSLDAEIFSTSSQGPTQIGFSNFLPSKQFITSVRIKLVPGRKSAFRKFAWRHASGITIASVSVAVVMQGTTVASARIAVGGVSAKPVLLLKAAATLQGQSAGQETIQEISRQAASEARHGCGEGVCGACNVLVEGVPKASCLLLALQAQGKNVVTAEGLEGFYGPQAALLKNHFVNRQSFQCGYCSCGMDVSSAHHAFSEGVKEPDIRHALAGNLCRCTGYQQIV